MSGQQAIFRTGVKKSRTPRGPEQPIPGPRRAPPLPEQPVTGKAPRPRRKIKLSFRPDEDHD